MKTSSIVLTLAILFCASTSWAQDASISQTITSINADAQKPGGPDRVLKSISASVHVPVATLAKEKTNTGLSYGDLYAGHAIANAAGKSFDQIAKQKKQGETWDKIADANNVSLGGKKVKKAEKPKTMATPVQQNVRPPSPPDNSGYRRMP